MAEWVYGWVDGWGHVKSLKIEQIEILFKDL